MSNTINNVENVTSIKTAEGWKGGFNFLRRHKMGLTAAGILLSGSAIIAYEYNQPTVHESPTIDLKQTHRVIDVPEGGTLSGIIASAYPETKNSDVDAIRDKRVRVAEEVVNTLNLQGEPHDGLMVGEHIPLPADAAIGRLVEPKQ